MDRRQIAKREQTYQTKRLYNESHIGESGTGTVIKGVRYKAL